MSSFVYRDVSVPEELRGIINYMPEVERYREELSNLGNQWDLLTILGQMGGTGTDMTSTREGFQNLTSELLGQLGLETLKKTAQDIGAKAQVAVDIVIRNLFERTADIGFLATDDDVREFLRAARSMDVAGDPAFGALQTALAARFQEYVSKYSVYFDIVLMDTRGKVVARLDGDVGVSQSADPLLGEALGTSREYVETFRAVDFLPDSGDSLIYAYRVTESNAPEAQSLGVLALCFRFQNEMEGIFHKLSNDGDWSVLTLLDRKGRVIASSDANQVRIGAQMELALEGDYRVVRFAGREYLAKTCETNGYEGFRGLGWMGHAMLPLEHAFDQNGSQPRGQGASEEVLEAVMSDPRLFSQALRDIPIQAESIQAELERTVWNGNVRETDAQSKVLLWNISDAGARTKSVFEKSIGNLHETVVSAILEDVEFRAALGVDIMDRNLYERANDCRWWALTTAFRRILGQRRVSPEDTDRITRILQYVNGLYTVYTLLFVYDTAGRILAVSKDGDRHLAGSSLNDEWVAQTLSIRDSQEYSVSAFEGSDLYGGRHTYVYGASITDLVDPKKVLGGIGIVFDSEPQFEAMLRDALPRAHDGSIVNGCFGVFAERSGKIISTTSSRFQVGEHLPVGSEFLALPNGHKASGILALDGQYYAVGGCTSAGYREYKVDDDYRNDVVGMVFVPLAEADVRGARGRVRREVTMQVGRARTGGKDCIEVATFHIGPKWLGLDASRVAEAVRYENVTDIPGAPPVLRGKIMHGDEVVPVVELYSEMGLEQPVEDSRLQIVIVRYTDQSGAERLVGICVDALGEIPEICQSRVDRTQSILDGKGYIECIIKPEPGAAKSGLLVVLSPEGLMKHLTGTLAAKKKAQPSAPGKPDLRQLGADVA